MRSFQTNSENKPVVKISSGSAHRGIFKAEQSKTTFIIIKAQNQSRKLTALLRVRPRGSSGGLREICICRSQCACDTHGVGPSGELFCKLSKSSESSLICFRRSVAYKGGAFFYTF